MTTLKRIVCALIGHARHWAFSSRCSRCGSYVGGAA